MRVNPNYTADMVNLLQQSRQSQNTALQELSTGRRVTNPSDDPAAEAAMIGENSRSAANDQYTASSDSLTAVLNTGSSTLSSVITLLTRAVSLAVEGANGTNNQNNLDSIATEISGIQNQVVALANTSYAGQYLFAGTAMTAAPYSADPTTGVVTYNGNDQQNKVQIGTGLSITANLPGSSIFSKSGTNVFDALQSLVTALHSGNLTDVATAEGVVDDSLNAVTGAQVFYGNAIGELTTNDSCLSQEKLSLATYQTTLVGIDTATAAMNAAQAQTALSATVAAASQMEQQTNLLSYLH